MKQKSSLITTIFWSNIILIVIVLLVMTGITVHLEKKEINEQID